MSKSSNKAFSSMVHASMRHAVPVLFWTAIILVILAIFMGYTEHLARGENDQTPVWTKYYLFLNVVFQGLTNASLPFVGAAFLWRIDKYLKQSKSEAAE